MAVAVVAVGSSAYEASASSIAVTTPAGSIGDLVVFFLTHDDYSDGDWSDSTPPVTLTKFINGSPQVGSDSRQAVFWGIEDQTAAQAYTFTISGTEQLAGVCVRFSGHDATTPIQSGSIKLTGGGFFLLDTNADRFGDMFVGYIGTDASFEGASAPATWTERVGVGEGGASAFNYIATKSADRYPFPMTLDEASLTMTHTTFGLAHPYAFVIAQDTSESYTLSGVTKDKDGVALGSCLVAMFKDIGGSPPAYEYVASVTSNASTGAYSFTVYENPSKFMVYAIKNDSPHVFDAGDNVLQPS